MVWILEYTRDAEKDAVLICRANLKNRVNRILEILEQNPFQTPPPYEKLKKDFRGLYSRRINLKHRLVYEVFKDEGIVRILRMWTHYE